MCERKRIKVGWKMSECKERERKQKEQRTQWREIYEAERKGKH